MAAARSAWQTRQEYRIGTETVRWAFLAGSADCQYSNTGFNKKRTAESSPNKGSARLNSGKETVSGPSSAVVVGKTANISVPSCVRLLQKEMLPGTGF